MQKSQAKLLVQEIYLHFGGIWDGQTLLFHSLRWYKMALYYGAKTLFFNYR